MKKRILIGTLFFLLGAIPELRAEISFSYRDGWVAEWSSTETPDTGLMALVMIKDGITNTSFLMAGEYRADLSVWDGEYAYILKDADGVFLEEGTVILSTPFTVTLTNVSSSNAEFIIDSGEPLFMEGYLYFQDSPVQYKRFTLEEEKTVSFDNLVSGTNYRVDFSAEDFSRSIEFSTPLRNIAMNKPVWGTFTRLPESQYVDDSTPAITRINDGLIEWYSGMAVSGEVASGEQIALVNLLTERNIREVKVIWSANYYPMEYRFVYSLDQEIWSEIERESGDYQSDIAEDNTPLMIDSFDTEIEAVYIGIIIEEGQEIYARYAWRNTVQWMEIEVYD